MALFQKDTNLYLIDLDQPLDGFHHFISCWIYTAHNRAVIVDPGPASTVDLVIQSLKILGIEHLDYILLTHVHIDHAGGTGLLSEKFPEAKIICQTKGIPHMIDPQKLWEGSLSVLGEIAKTYGPIAPVSEDRITFDTKVRNGGLQIKIIETPGHATHHVCYLIDGFLFAGEVAGVNFPLSYGSYLRIATPPKFVYEVYKKSLEKTARVDCHTICFGHYDLRTDTRDVFDQALNQLELWISTCRTQTSGKTPINEEEIFDRLSNIDPAFKEFPYLPEDVKKRETYFVRNSIKGMIDYLTNQK